MDQNPSNSHRSLDWTGPACVALFFLALPAIWWLLGHPIAP